jgi:hypothetical protein
VLARTRRVKTANWVAAAVVGTIVLAAAAAEVTDLRAKGGAVRAVRRTFRLLGEGRLSEARRRGYVSEEASKDLEGAQDRYGRIELRRIGRTVCQTGGVPCLVEAELGPARRPGRYRLYVYRDCIQGAIKLKDGEFP